MINKNGNITINNFYESNAMNQLNGTRYTNENPYILTGTSNDIYRAIDNECKVEPGSTYYLMCQCNKEWSPRHGYLENVSKGKVTIWLYLSKEYNKDSYSYDSPISFTSSNMITNGVWKYTIPSGYNMVRIRVNTYSDGETQITAKFWDIALIPEKYYISSTPPTKIHHLSILERTLFQQEKLWNIKSSEGGDLI